MYFIFLFLVSTSALTVERQALCALAEAIPHLQTIGWKSCAQMSDTLSLSGFQGLEYSVATRGVVGVRLSGSACSGTLPNVFNSFPQLRTLDVSETSLSGTLPGSLATVKEVLKLNVNPGLSGTIPALAETLQQLLIRESPFFGTLPATVTRMAQLRIITVHNTEIEDTLEKFMLLPKIAHVDLRSSLFHGTLPSSLAPSLTQITVVQTELIGSLPAEYLRAPLLESLVLDGNSLTGTIPAVLSRLSRLSLAENKLTGTLPKEALLGRLTTVNLAGNRLTGTIPEALFTASHVLLQQLTLSRNELRGTLPTIITGLDQLNELNLADNQFQGEIPANIFSGIRFLSSIDWSGNQFNGTLKGNCGGRSFRSFSLANNSLVGSIAENYFSGSSFSTFDLSGNAFTGCAPLEPAVTGPCVLGDGFFSGCSPSYARCNLTFVNNCLEGSGYYGPTCRRCTCVSGLLCRDGVSGNGTCEGFNPCRNHTCEGICNINGNSYVCSCPFPAIINSTNQRSCDCPFGFMKNAVGGGCSPCPKIDNCLGYASCTSCSVCTPGYALTSAGQCALNKNCLFSEWTAWSVCDRCDGGLSLRYRNLSENNTALPFYCQEFLYNRTSCGYPCVETTITSKDAILDYLYRSFTQWNWLESVTNSSELVVEKTPNQLLISPPLDISFLEQSVSQILPLVNASRYIFRRDANATSIEVLAEETASVTNVVVGAVIGAAVPALFLALFFVRRRRKKWLFDLPDELQHHFHVKGSGWITEGSCKMKEIPFNDTSFRAVWDVLSIAQLPVQRVYSVCNPVLGASFSNYRSILRQRMTENPILFCKQDWRLRSEKSELRSYTHERYLQLTEYFSWNDPEETVPILACLHATDFGTAKSIASKGFCALATLDEGFYGKGIYFSTYGSYVAPYCAKKQGPAVLINLVIGGNAFPIVEGPHESGNFLGKPTVSGYQSHFVLTKSDGMPITKAHTDDESNELVLGQEAQVVPIYIVCLHEDCKLQEFTRSTSSLLTPLLVEDDMR